MRRSITNSLKRRSNQLYHHFLGFILLMFAAHTAQAQNWTIAGCSNLGSTSYGPMYSVGTANAASRTAVIYQAGQLAGIAGKTLTGMYFERTTTSGAMGGTPNFKIYLKEVSDTAFAAGALTWSTSITGATLVYDSNPIAAVGNTAGWKGFTFSSNFSYSGTQHLAVFMEYANAGASTSISWTYEYGSPCISTSNSNTTRYSNNTTGSLTATLASTNYRRPAIGFDFVMPACSGTPVAGTISTTSQTLCAGVTPATLTTSGHTFGFNGISYQWEESDDDGMGDPWSNATGGSGATTPSFTPPAFSGNPIYYRLKVTCQNGGGMDVSASSAISPVVNPSTPVTGITFSNITNTSMTIGWTNGSGNRRFVVVNTANVFTDPVDGTTGPGTASSTYSGTGQQVVYDNTGSSVTVNGLSCNATYYVRVYEYQRCGTSSNYTYLYNTTPTANNPASQNTAVPAPVALPVSTSFTGFTGSNLPATSSDWYEAKITTSSGSVPMQTNPLTLNSLWTYSTDLGDTTAVINLYTTTRNEWIVSPLMSVTSASRLRFKAAITENGTAAADPAGMQNTDDSVHVLVSTDGCGATWTPLYTFHAGNTTTLSNVLKDYFIDLSAYVNQNIRVAFQATDGPVDNSNDYDVHIDDVIIEPVPACDVPSNITVTSAAAISAVLGWTASASAPANGYDYFVSPSTAAPSAATTPSGSVAAGTVTATATGLAPVSTYYAWVRANCGTGTSTWEGPVSFVTTPANDNCADATTLTVNTGLTCTAVTSGSTVAATQSAETAPSCAATGVNDDVWYKFVATAPAHRISLDNVSGSTNMAMALYSGSCGSLTAVSCSDPNSFDAFGLTVNATYYVRVWTVSATATTTASFDICVGTIGCPYPSATVASNPTTNSVDLAWTENGSASMWEIEYGPANFVQGTGTKIIATTNPYTLTGLSSTMGYSVYVRSICGSGDTSAPGTKVNFNTVCATLAPGYSQNFGAFVPACWTEQTGTLGSSTVLTGTSSGWTSDDWMNTTGTNDAAKVNIYAASKNDWLISPTIDLGPGGNNYHIKFDLAFLDFSDDFNLNLGSDDTLAVVISTDNGATWSSADVLQLWTAANSNLASQQVVLSLAAYTGLVKIGFYASEGTVNDVNDVDVMVDNFEILSNPLAIRLNSIEAANAGNRNRIDWNTAAEDAGDLFELERSTDGKAFARIATVNAKGEGAAYTYWDEQPVAGVNYYRLKLVSPAGSGSYSRTVTATVKAGGAVTMTAYPNPVRDVLTVKLGGAPQGTATLTVTDRAGKLVKVLAVSGQVISVDMKLFAEGVYILKYQDAANSGVVKVSKQ